MAAIDLTAVQQSTFFTMLPGPLQLAWLPLLTQVTLEQGAPVLSPRQPVQRVLFPLDAVIAVVNETASGQTAMMWMLGYEGVSGIPALFSGAFRQGRSMVLFSGEALALPANAFVEAFHDHREFRTTLMRYIQAVLIHIGQVAVCNRHCPAEGQLATNLLRAVDRKRSNELRITQERMGHVLGWRRETVTLALQRLARKGAIEHRRGSLVLADRAAAEGLACSCYSTLQRSFQEIWTAPAWRQEPYRS